MDHIHKRGRDYEGNMSLDYLKKLNKRYDSWIESYTEGPLLIINADKLNFIDSKDDLGAVIEMIDAELNGLYSNL